MLKVALAQINTCVGDIKYNADKIISNINKAKSVNADIVIFPELSLTGYPPEDLLLKPHFIEENLRYLKIIEKETKGIIALLGFVDKLKEKIYNSCAFLKDGALKDVYRKIYLPNYGVFDEKRYFSPGDLLSFYSFKGYKFCVSICEDVWREGFVRSLSRKKLDFIVNISASPFHLGKISAREKILANLARRTNAFVFYTDLIGGQDELVFDGTSMVVSSSGKTVSAAKRFEEDFLLFELNHKKDYPAKKIEVKEEEEAYSALKLGLYDYVKKNGFKKVIIGVSGGIDSAVVAAMAASSLGKENVCGLIMPSRYTSKGTFSDAKKICENLGIAYNVVSIDEILNTYLKILLPLFKRKDGTKTEENLQARIRGSLLMAYSNEFGYLVLNTGNKSEVSCGYCTLYGDMVGGFGLLKDVPKTLVYKISRYINRLYKKEIIPVSTIRRPPSAELKPNQKDTDTLPPYPTLDPIIKLYVEDDFSLEKLVKKGFNRKLIRKVIGMIDSSEYKRRQGPIGIKITPRAFGRDRRMPITNKFNY
ncbi:MAG: NAD+ synthase [Candidatus Omnitrophica bacterium]|nr:NAD+ synthase [Candidatus Omnitrophota bacterium]